MPKGHTRNQISPGGDERRTTHCEAENTVHGHRQAHHHHHPCCASAPRGGGGAVACHCAGRDQLPELQWFVATIP
eukprot:1628725-Rhodomonas_salina.3